MFFKSYSFGTIPWLVITVPWFLLLWFTGSKGRSHGKKKGVRPDDFLSKFGSDAGEPTTSRAEPIPVPKLMQRTQVKNI